MGGLQQGADPWSQYAQQAPQQPYDPNAQATTAFSPPAYNDPANPYATQQVQPEWPNPQPPAGRTKMWVIVGLVAVLLLGGGGVVVAKFVLGKKVFDAAAMDRDIAQQYKERFAQTVQVDCPTGQEVKVGGTFECTMKDSSKKITIEVKDSSGTYQWRITGG
jgi:hypothetical protein